MLRCVSCVSDPGWCNNDTLPRNPPLPALAHAILYCASRKFYWALQEGLLWTYLGFGFNLVHVKYSQVSHIFGILLQNRTFLWIQWSSKLNISVMKSADVLHLSISAKIALALQLTHPILGGVTLVSWCQFRVCWNPKTSAGVEIVTKGNPTDTFDTPELNYSKTLMSSLVLTLLLYYIFRVSECFNKSLKCSATKTAWRSWVAVHNSLELVKQPLVYIQLLS